MKNDPGRWLWALAAVASIATFAVVDTSSDRIGRTDGVVAIVALDEDEAAIVYADAIELVTAEGGVRWRAAIPPLSAAALALPPLVRPSLVVADADRVYVRGRGEHGPELVALSRRDGGELWRAQPLQGVEDQVGLGFDHDRVGRALAGPVIVDAYRYEGSDDAWVLLAGTDGQSGELAWRAKLGPDSRGPLWVRGDRIVFGAQGVLHVFRAGDGAPVSLFEEATPVCVFDDELVYAQRRGFTVSTLEGARPAPIPIAEALDAAPGDSLTLRACGRYDGAYILAVEAGDATHLLSLAGPLAEHAGGFELRWHIELGERQLPPIGRFDEVGSRHPDRSPLAGELPRYVPIKLGAGELVMLDLAEGQLAWRADLEPTTQLKVYAHGDDAIAHDGASGLLARIDGATGQIAAAARVDGEVSALDPDSGQIWLHRDRAWAVLDSARLELRAPSEVDWVSPLSPASLARELGFPARAAGD